MDAVHDPIGAVALAPVKLADGIVAQLSEAVLEGRLGPGEALPSEARLAERFGVSKQVVREALHQLAAVGVVEIGQGRATRVRAPDAAPLARILRFAVGRSREGLAEAVELRRIIEPQVARLAAMRADEAGIAALRRIADRLAAACGDVPAWIDADLDFHDHLAALSGNRLVRLQVASLRPLTHEVMVLLNGRTPRDATDWQATLKRHTRVVSAIAAHNPDAAERAMAAHFETAEAAIAAIFAGQGPKARTTRRRKTP
ncbi:FadR/GntR family transcriptional regulator [Elioraea rosea]|uniref:FadR/GntR family transcriptional regulator n=1 Tax=Elioraea rosea TaxID=2492390 RepID=UPI0011837070|nr:FadR/GntR family transcriptional regulator [Elioraea rosea]